MSPPPSLYRLTPAGRDLAWESWDPVHAVYQRASGETHVFNEATTLTLECLTDQPMTLEGVVRRVAGAIGVDEDELASENFLAVATRLEELGLVERLDQPPSAS